MNKEKELEFEQYLQKIEDPEYDGQDVTWHLPKNATLLQKIKYNICERMLIYQQDNNLTDKEIADKVRTSIGEVRDILYYHIDYFTLDRLITYASRLFSSKEIKVIFEPKRQQRGLCLHYEFNEEYKNINELILAYSRFLSIEEK